LEYAKKTLWSCLKNLKYSDGLRLHIASDGDSEEYIQELHSVGMNFLPEEVITHTNSERGSYGRNYNLAMQVVHQVADIVLPLEDDWELVQELDLDKLVEPLHNGYGCVRMGYVGWTQPLRCEFVGIAGSHYLLFDHDSPEPHVFAGHPRLESVNWARNVGPWPEGLLPGETEFVVAQRKESRQGVVWPVEFIKPSGNCFVHIGAQRSY
jgi:hypothetical protein